MDLYYEPYTSPWMSNLTLLTNGNDVAVRGLSLPGGDWVNSIVHGVSEAALSLRYSYYCDGYAAICRRMSEAVFRCFECAIG